MSNVVIVQVLAALVTFYSTCVANGALVRRVAASVVVTRKSTEEGLEQQFNSLDAQREACAAYIVGQRHEGWLLVPDHYDDGGISGGTMERPGLKRLLEQVRLGKVDVIVVYKVDRLTRALSDFAKIVDILDEAEASFVSITQAFNTTTSMGRLTLNVLLSFAQFEREVISERVRDKVAASKAKGIWMGGCVPLGYRAEPVQQRACKGSVKKGLKAHQSGDYETALCHWLPKAQAGDAAAQNNMGVLFEQGLAAQTPQSDSNAADWFILAAQQGFVPAMQNLAAVQMRNGLVEQANSWVASAAATTAAAQQQRQLAWAEAISSVGAAIGCAVGGCVGSSPATPAYPRREASYLHAVRRSRMTPNSSPTMRAASVGPEN